MALMVPYGAASLVANACAKDGVLCGDGLSGILIWATRPRGTAGVFLANAIFAFWADAADRKVIAEAYPNRRSTRTAGHIPMLGFGMLCRPQKEESMQWGRGSDKLLANPFLTTCVSAMITEAHIAMIGVLYWSQPSLQRDSVMGSYRYQDQAPCLFDLAGTVLLNVSAITSPGYESHQTNCTEHTNNEMVVASFGLWVTVVSFTALVLFYLWFSFCYGCCCGSRSKDNGSKNGMNRGWYYRACFWFSFAWFFLAGSFAFSWLMWSAFLNGTSDQDYCISNINALDALFISYPCVLALWRQLI